MWNSVFSEVCFSNFTHLCMAWFTLLAPCPNRTGCGNHMMHLKSEMILHICRNTIILIRFTALECVFDILFQHFQAELDFNTDDAARLTQWVTSSATVEASPTSLSYWLHLEHTTAKSVRCWSFRMSTMVAWSMSSEGKGCQCNIRKVAGYLQICA